MRIPLDRHGGTPLYRQIEDWLRHNITSGALQPGTRLPATRALASKLAVSRITVVNAYAALEGDGLIVTGNGNGTFVAPMGHDPARVEPAYRPSWPLWQRELPEAGGSAAGDGPAAGDGRAAGPHPDPIRFTGVGDPRLFAVRDLDRSVHEVLGQQGTDALEYGPLDHGHPPLRATVARLLASQGIQAHPDQVLITSGSQQALALTCQLLLRPGDVVVVEQPTYNLALELFGVLGARPVGVPIDAAGMRTDLLEPLLQQHRVRLIYTVPNFANPSGACLSGPRRRHLLGLADRYNVPILEDDFAGDLRYEGRAQPAVKALDATGQVIYTGTFSKLMMPGLRVGYLLADGPVLAELARRKRVQDLTTSPLLQRVLDRHVTVGRYQAHLRRTGRLYRERRDVLLAALRTSLPELVVADPPKGGLFVWATTPVPARTLLPVARAEGVDFAPGHLFFPRPQDGDGFLRLNFATVEPDRIGVGVERLARAVHALR